MQILALAKAWGFVFCLIDFMLIAAVRETVIRTEKHKKESEYQPLSSNAAGALPWHSWWKGLFLSVKEKREVTHCFMRFLKNFGKL